ncbi:MAG: heme-binding protein [Pseudomonadota bacterium]
MLTITRLDIADARILIEGARKRADEIGVPMCIAVTDEGGNLVAFERMDGGKVTSITIAIDKSYTASAAKKATHEYGAASQPGAPAYGIDSAIGGRLMVVGGGLPIHVEGDVVGAIGVSSGTPAQDQDVAQAGIDYFLKQI